MEFERSRPKEFSNLINGEAIGFSSTKMGLKRRSVSMPKLFTKFKDSYDVTADNNKTPRENDLITSEQHEKSKEEGSATANIITSRNNIIENNMDSSYKERSQIIQIFSGGENSRELGMRILKFSTTQQSKQPEMKDSPDGVTIEADKNKSFQAASKHSTRPGFSERFRGMFNSIFHLNRRHDGTRFKTEFNSSLPSHTETTQQRDSIRHSKSLPDLNSKIKPIPKDFPRQRSFLFGWARKAKKRSKSNRIERQDSYSSANPSSSCESSPDLSWHKKKHFLKRGTKSVDLPSSHITLNNDDSHASPHFARNYESSPASSPSSFADISGSSNQVYFNGLSPRFSPDISRPSSSQALSNAESCSNKNRMLSQSLSGGLSFDKHLSRIQRQRRQFSKSLSESSENSRTFSPEDLNNSMISSASFAAQRKRRIFASNSKSYDKIDGADLSFRQIFKEDPETSSQGFGMEQKKQNFSERQNDIIYNIIQRELARNLQGKEFHPQESRIWCTNISDSIKSKIEVLTGGVFKIIVQVFIGAVEDEGVMTATQCSLSPRIDNFTVASYRHDCIFAFASVLAIDFREISVPAKTFQNMLYAQVHTSCKNDETRDVRG